MSVTGQGGVVRLVRRHARSLRRIGIDTGLSASLACRAVDARVAVLASGGGTNLQALLDHDVVGSWIAVVVSDRADAQALERARARGVPAVFVDPAAAPDRTSHDEGVAAVLREHGADVIALAGYMRVLGPAFVKEFSGRILNVHPALLPAFPGGTAVAEALAWGAKVTGVTVHLVDDEVDHGPIVSQEAIEVRPGDDWDSLEARVHEVEHRLLPGAVRALAEGRLEIDGRHVVVKEA